MISLALGIGYLCVGVMFVAVWGIRIVWELIKTAVVLAFAVFVVLIVTGCTPVETDDGNLVRTKELTAENHLPTKCRPYYNDGTGRWIECMGVGLK